ncbi:uncharacterized protein LOC122254597 [Penaeus japonicus]|uniref:uncharacterized protein LOC122254597 n=1 Tax=Penaeus japonicus TaxID=27405 RepID=UPI001C7171AE|nr:uncharacterized protein LOC122254597 [Penaeus japonicus]
MPGLRSLVARRRSILASPPYSSVPTPPHSQQNSPCAEESSLEAEGESCLSPSQTQVNGDVPSENKETLLGKDEKSDYSEVIATAQETESSGKVAEVGTDAKDGASSDRVNGSRLSVNQSTSNNDKESEKRQTENELPENQVGLNGVSSMKSRELNDNDQNNGTVSSPTLRKQTQESKVPRINRSAMEIESTLAKRGVTIVRRLVDCKDPSNKPKAEATQARIKDSVVVNGTVITANPLNTKKNIESRLGRIASSLKGSSISLNTRGYLGQPLRGGATVSPNSVGRPQNNTRELNPRNVSSAKGINLQHPGQRGLPRHQNPSGFPAQSNVKGALTLPSVRPSLRPSFPRDPSLNKSIVDSRRVRGVGPVSSVSSPVGELKNQRAVYSPSILGSAPKDALVKGLGAFPSPKRPLDYTDPRKAAPYSSPRRVFSQANSPQSWPASAGSRSFAATQHQRSVTPSPQLRAAVPSPQSRSSAMSPQSSSTTSPQSLAVSPRSTSSVPSPQSKVGNYQARSGEISPYSKAQEVSPASRSAEVSPQSRAPELSPSSRSAEVSPLSRTSDLSPLSRSVEASPQHRASGITQQSKYPLGFSPQTRSAELSPASRSGTLASQSSPPAISQSQLPGLASQSVPVGLPSSLAVAPSNGAGPLQTNSVGLPPQSSLGLLSQQTNSLGLSQESLPFGQSQHSNSSRISGSANSLGFPGLPTSSFIGRTSTDGYSAGSSSSKYPLQPSLEGFSSQLTPGGFPLHSSPANFAAQSNLPGFPNAANSCGFPQPASSGEFPAQNSGGIPEQLNPNAFGSHPALTGYPNQTNSGYPPQSSSGGYSLNSNTNEFHESSPEVLGYPSPRNFPMQANSREYSAYSNSENTPTPEMTSHASPRDLPVSHNSREISLQNCTQGMSLNPATGNSMNSVGRESQVHSNYNETLVHPSYHDPNTFPRSNPGDLPVLPDFRDHLRHSYRETSLIPPYRPETIPNSFRDTPLQNTSRNPQTVSNYRELPLIPNISDIQSQTSPRGPALHNNYKEQNVSNNYREHNMIGSYVESPALTNYREPIDQTGQREQPLPSFRETMAHTSPREQVLPSFREALDPANCREQMLPGFRETLSHTSPREQSLPTYNENVNHNSPRGEVLPGFSETLNHANLRPQVLPSFSDTMNHTSPRAQGLGSFREPVDYTNFRDPLDHNSITEPSLQSRIRDTVDYNSDYTETANQSHIAEPSHNTYEDYRANAHSTTGNSPVNLKYKDTGDRNPYTKSVVLPSFTESFECGSSGEYQKDGNMMHNFGESSGYVSTRRNSECSRYEQPPYSACSQSSSYSPTHSSESPSPDANSPVQQDADGQCRQVSSPDPNQCTPRSETVAVTESQASEDCEEASANHDTEMIQDLGKYLRGRSSSLEKSETVGETADDGCTNSEDVSKEPDPITPEPHCHSITSKDKDIVVKAEPSIPSSPGDSLNISSLPSSPNKYATVGSPSKLNAGSSPSSQERIVIKMKLLHSEARSENDKHKRGDPTDESNSRSEHRNCIRYPNVKYTRWTIDSIINGREDGNIDEISGKDSKKEHSNLGDEEHESLKNSKPKQSVNGGETSTNLDTNKNLMKPLRITIPNPHRTRIHTDGSFKCTRKMDNHCASKETPNDMSSPGSSRITRSSSRLEASLKGRHGYPIRKLKLKNMRLASPFPSSESHTSPVSASQKSYKRRRRSRRDSELSDASVSSVSSVLNEGNDHSVVAQMKKCSIVIKRIYTADNNSCYSSTLCSKRSTENSKCDRPRGRPKRKAAVEASERCHKSLRSLDKCDIKSNKIPYNGAFYKGRQLMSVNLRANNVDVKNVITQCSVILYDVFMNRRINSMVCPGCSRNYDSSDSVQVNISKATISLLCSVCQWLVVKDVHPHEVHSIAPS